MAVQQGRSERRPEEVQSALRVGRSPFYWILANGKAPAALPTSEELLRSIEGLSDARTELVDFSKFRQNASFAQRMPVPLGRLSMVPQSRSLARRLIAGLSQDPPRIALIAPREGP